MRLVGEFNVDNALTVLAVLLAWDVPLKDAVRALGKCRAASGRMEMFGGRGRTPLAIVDYAHTPDALANALRAARLHCRGELRVVFGCGGDRDAGKRPLMGRIAAELADDIIVTDDNPRSEDPARIVAEIVAGMRHGTPHVIEHDRALAIRMALERSGADDVVLVAGKGHEDYQIVGSERRAVPGPGGGERAARQACSHEAHAGRIRARLRWAPERGRRRVHGRGERLAQRSARGSCSWRSRGPNFDGADFVAAAAQAGAAGALVTQRAAGAAAADRRAGHAGGARARRARLARSSSQVRWSGSPAATARPPPRR